MNQTVNADPAELAKVSDLAHRWWDPESEFRPLHQINPLRLEWINGLSPLQGQLVLDTPGLQLHWAQGRLQWLGGLTLDALDVTSPLSTLQPLGSYRLSLSTRPGQPMPALQLHTLHGELALQGEGQWSGARFRFRGTAQASPASVGAVSNLLNLLGRRDGG